MGLDFHSSAVASFQERVNNVDSLYKLDRAELMDAYWKEVGKRSDQSSERFESLNEEVEERALTMLKEFGSIFLDNPSGDQISRCFVKITEWKEAADAARRHANISDEVIAALKTDRFFPPDTHLYKDLTHLELAELYQQRERFHNTFCVLSQIAIAAPPDKTNNMYMSEELKPYQTVNRTDTNNGFTCSKVFDGPSGLSALIAGLIKKHLLSEEQPFTPARPPLIDEILISFYHFLKGYYHQNDPPVSFSLMTSHLREKYSVPLKALKDKENEWGNSVAPGTEFSFPDLGKLKVSTEIPFRSSNNIRYFSQKNGGVYTIAVHPGFKADLKSPIFPEIIQRNWVANHCTLIRKIAPFEKLSCEKDIAPVANFIRLCAKEDKTPLSIHWEHLCWEIGDNLQICSLFQDLKEGFDYRAFEQAIPILAGDNLKFQDLLFERSGMRSEVTLRLFSQSVELAIGLRNSVEGRMTSPFYRTAQTIQGEAKALKERCNQLIDQEYEQKYRKQMHKKVPQHVNRYFQKKFKEQIYYSITSSNIETEAGKLLINIFKEIQK